MSSELEDRIVTLEIQITHQVSMLEDLSQMVTRQWDSIDRLTRQVKGLQETVLELEETGGVPAQTKPPHY